MARGSELYPKFVLPVVVSFFSGENRQNLGKPQNGWFIFPKMDGLFHGKPY